MTGTPCCGCLLHLPSSISQTLPLPLSSMSPSMGEEEISATSSITKVYTHLTVQNLAPHQCCVSTDINGLCSICSSLPTRLAGR